MEFSEVPSAISAVNKKLVSRFVRFFQGLSVDFNSAIASIYFVPRKAKD